MKKLSLNLSPHSPSRRTTTVATLALLLCGCLLLSIIVDNTCFTSASTIPFLLINQHNRNAKASSTSSGDVSECCLPSVYSMNGYFTDYTINSTTGNANLLASSFNTTQGMIKYTSDYNDKKLRIDTMYYDTKKGKIVQVSNWIINYGIDANAYWTYQDGQCDCRRFQFEWKSPCISRSTDTIKGNVGQYQSMLIFDKNEQSTTLVYRDENNFDYNTCWISSQNTVEKQSVHQVSYMDMSTNIDSNVFNLPSTCGPVRKCM